MWSAVRMSGQLRVARQGSLLNAVRRPLADTPLLLGEAIAQDAEGGISVFRIAQRGAGLVSWAAR